MISKGFEMRRDTLKENKVESFIDDGVSSQVPRPSQSPYGSTILSPGGAGGVGSTAGANVVLIPTTNVEFG